MGECLEALQLAGFEVSDIVLVELFHELYLYSFKLRKIYGVHALENILYSPICFSILLFFRLYGRRMLLWLHLYLGIFLLTKISSH
jgi:hypothetical protein